eukprot:319390-Hanusia_phi.AAC.2
MQVEHRCGMGEYGDSSYVKYRRDSVRDVLARTKILKWLIERETAGDCSSESLQVGKRFSNSRPRQKQSKIEELEKHISSLEAELNQTKNALKEAKEHEQSLATRLRTLQVQVQNLNNSNCFSSDRLDSMRSRACGLKVAMETLEQELRLRSNARARLVAALNHSKESLEQTSQLLALERQIHSIITESVTTPRRPVTVGQMQGPTANTEMRHVPTPSSETSLSLMETLKTVPSLRFPADALEESRVGSAESQEISAQVQALKQLKIKHRSQIAGAREHLEKLRNQNRCLRENRLRWTPTALRQEANKIAYRCLLTSSDESISLDINT